MPWFPNLSMVSGSRTFLRMGRPSYHIVERLVCSSEEHADVVRGLTDALLVLHQSDMYVTVAVSTEADAGTTAPSGFCGSALSEARVCRLCCGT